MKVPVAGVLLVCLGLVGTGVVLAQEPPARQSPPPAPAAQTTPLPSPEALGVSLERVKSALKQKAPGLLKIQDEPPTFRVSIVGKRNAWLPNYVESLKFEREAVSSAGRYHDEFINLVTPPQARPYGASSSSELVQVMATSLVTALVAAQLQKAVGSLLEYRHERRASQVREEVRRELEAFLKAHPEAPRPVWWPDTIR